MSFFISCDYCGSNFDIDTYQECPNCGGKYSEDAEFLDWKLKNEDEDIRTARRERIELAEKKARAARAEAEAERNRQEAERNRAEAMKNHEAHRSLSGINSILFGVQRFFRNLRRGCSTTITIIILGIILYLIYKYFVK